MKWLVVGDMHYKRDNGHITSRLEEIVLTLASTVNFIVLIGDIGDYFNVGEMRVSCRIYELIRRLREDIKIPVYLLIGNHDRENNRDFMTNIHFYNAYKHWNGVKVIDKTLVDIINGHKFVFVPYVPDGQFGKALEGVDLTNVVSVFCHQTFRCYNSKGDLVPSGCRLIISGHIHNSMRITIEENNALGIPKTTVGAKNNIRGRQIVIPENVKNATGWIRYVGTPYQVTAAENIGNTISVFSINNEGDDKDVDVTGLLLKDSYTYDNIIERCYLTRLTSKRTDVVNLMDLHNYEGYKDIHVMSDLRVKVQLYSGQLAILKSHSKYIELVTSGVQVTPVFLEVAEEVNNDANISSTFIQELLDEFTSDERTIFEGLF